MPVEHVIPFTAIGIVIAAAGRHLIVAATAEISSSVERTTLNSSLAPEAPRLEFRCNGMEPVDAFIVPEKAVKALSDERKVEIILYYQQKEAERLEKLRAMGKKYRMNKREKELAMKKELAELRAKVAKAE